MESNISSISGNYSTNNIVENDFDSNKDKFLFYGLLAYAFIFYTQIAFRIPVLKPLRIEFIVGSILLFTIIFKIIKGDINLFESKITVGGFLFFFVAFLTIPFALVKSTSLETFLQMLKFSAIYFMIIASINNEKRLKIYFYLYLFLVAFIFIEPFFNSLQGKGFIWNNGMWRLAGATSAFGHPNQLGGMTSANLPLFYYLMKYEKSKVKKFLYLSVIIMGIRVVMLTESRTGFLGILTFGFFIWILSKKKLMSLFIGIFLLIILWQFAPPQTKARFLTFFSVEKVLTTDRDELRLEDEQGRLASMASRWILIKRAWGCFLEYPILGVGLRNFNSYNGHRFGLWHPPHNTYLQALAEMGIIGFASFIFFLLMIYKSLKTSKKLLSMLPDDERFLKALTNAVMVYFLVRLVVSTFGQDLYVNYWWVAGGFAMVIHRISLNKYETYLRNSELSHIKTNLIL